MQKHQRPIFVDAKTELEKVYDKYGGILFKYALMILADHAAAEDAVQQVFTRLINKKDAIFQIESYDQYLRKAVRNECYENLRNGDRFKGLVKKLSSGPILEPCEHGENDPQQRRMLENAIKKLPAQQREVLLMKIYENKTFAQIAADIDVSINTVASRYRYAIDKLKETIGEPDYE